MIDNTTSRGRTLRFLYDGSHDEFKKALYALGEAPLPSFIRRPVEEEDTERFQTIFAKNEGAVTSPVSKLGWVSTPLTMETNDGLFLSIHEANLTDYAAMNLIPKEGSMTLKANLTPWSTGEKVFMKAPVDSVEQDWLSGSYYLL